MTLADKVLPSRCLKAIAIEEGEVVTLTIAGWKVEQLQSEEGAKEKLFLSFQETQKLLTMNTTKVCVMKGLYGDHIEPWVGKKIDITRGTTPFRGTMVPCINILPEVPSDTAPPTQPTAPAEDSEAANG